MTRSRFRHAFVWLVAVLPVLILARVLYLHALPRSFEGRVVQLAGEWKLRDADDQAFARPDFDDSAWSTVRLPTFNTSAERPLWIRRTFELPDRLLGKELFLMAGGFWSGTEVYLNGRKVAQGDLYTRGPKPEFFGIEGWDLAPERVRPGRNVIAIRMTQLVLFDSRLLLGERSLLRPYFLANSDLKRSLLDGTFFLLAFFVALLVVLRVQEEDRRARAEYDAALHAILGATFYVGMNNGVLGVMELGRVHVLLTFLSIIYVMFGITEFVHVYVMRRDTAFRWIHRWISAGGAATLLVLFVANRPHLTFKFWEPFSAYEMVPMLFAAVAVPWFALRDWSRYGPILASSVSIVMVAGVLDILTTLRLANFPRLSPLASANMAIVFAILIIADFLKISYRNKELSASLTRSNSELATALAAAEESARLKGEFVANVSHELRTPLNAIVNIPEGLIGLFARSEVAACSSCSTQFELEPGDRIDGQTECPECKQKGTMTAQPRWALQTDPAELVSNLEMLGTSGRHLLSLIDSVLDFSKLEARRMTLQLEEVSPLEALNEVLRAVGPLAARRGMELALVGCDPAWRLRADRVKFAQVFINLLGNAIKFSPDQSRVEVSARREDNALVFAVQDRGIGIPASARELIFESFRQVDGSHTRKFGGTGLGLAISKQLVELHGGAIWVDSTEGVGSTFYVRLPIRGPAAEPEEAATSLAPAASPVGATKTVLVVDDEPVAIEAVRLALRTLGHRVVGVSDPRDFAAALAEHKPDLIILDIMMPRVSGLELLQELRSGSAAQTQVIVSSAHDGNRETVAEQGVPWLAKPWSTSELVAQVKRLLGEAPVETTRRSA